MLVQSRTRIALNCANRDLMV